MSKISNLLVLHKTMSPQNSQFIIRFPMTCDTQVRFVMPSLMFLPARNGLVNEVEFLGLLPKCGKDQ